NGAMQRQRRSRRSTSPLFPKSGVPQNSKGLWDGPIIPLTALDLDELGNQAPSATVLEILNRLALRLQTQARASLPLGWGRGVGPGASSIPPSACLRPPAWRCRGGLLAWPPCDALGPGSPCPPSGLVCRARPWAWSRPV